MARGGYSAMGSTLGARFELTDSERHFVVDALRRAHTCADGSVPIAQLLGIGEPTEFIRLVDRLSEAVQSEEPLSDDDWGRTLILAETAWCDVADDQARSAAEQVLSAIHHRIFDARAAAIPAW